MTRSEQRRRLRDLERPEEDRAVDETQREGARLLALELGFLAERVEAGGDADGGILLHHLAEAGNGTVERAKEIVDVLRLDARRDTIEGRLRHAGVPHLLRSQGRGCR